VRSDIFDEPPVIQPPDSVTVEKPEPKPILYRADGTALVRDSRIGFKTTGKR